MRYGDRNCFTARSYPRRRYFRDPAALSNTQALISTPTTRITAERAVGGERLSRWRSDHLQYCTMANPIQTACQPNLEHHFLLISNVNTCQALQQKCRAICPLQLCNMMMPQKLIGSCLNLSLKLMASICQSDFQTYPTWQPDFRLTFLWIFLNKWAYHLKQSCSPKIDLHSWCGDLGQILNNLEDKELQSWANVTEFQTV